MSIWLTMFVLLLGHDDFEVREAATAGLVSLNNRHDCRQIITAHARDTGDPEVRRRLEGVLENYGELCPELFPYFPRVEFLKPDDWDEEYAQTLTKYDIQWDWGEGGYAKPPDTHREHYDDDSNRRRASHYWSSVLLDRGKTRQEVGLMMRVAIDRERKFGRIPTTKPEEPE